MYSVVDLFSGAGGLSLGFQQTQKFEIKVAFENNSNAQKTYIRNHPGIDMFNDVCKANYLELKEKYGEIDVVIGGPPCQGFSNANRQKNCVICQNNILVKQYIRAVIELQPKAFIMENVGMLKSDVHRFYMTRGDEKTVADYNIKTTDSVIQLLDSKYIFEGAVRFVQDINMIVKYLWNPADYLLINKLYRHKSNIRKLVATVKQHSKKLEKFVEKFISINRLSDGVIHKANISCAEIISEYLKNEASTEKLINEIEPALMYQRMLGKAKELHDNDIIVKKFDCASNLVAIIESFGVYDSLAAILGAPQNGYVIDGGVLCAADYGAPQKRMRFVIMGIKKAISAKVALPLGKVRADAYTTVRDAISDLSIVLPIYELADDKGISLPPADGSISELGKKLRDSNLLYNHIVTDTKETALKRFAAIKQGQNFHSLDASMKEDTYTDVSRTQNTIYLRLNYNEPSDTVINVRKSMWIHPEFNRAISVREAARLQTFPDSFIFEGTKDSQYQQVGNAVPPMLAEAIANKLALLLD